MAGGRRVSRVITKSSNNVMIFPMDDRPPPTNNLIMKHIRLPPLPRESNLMFEMILLFHVTIFTSLQFLHLYRTVWWLPQSFNSTGMNFHLIDGNLVVFTMAVLARRVPYLLLKSLLPSFSHWMLQLVLTLHMLVWLLITSYSLVSVKYDDHGYKGHVNTLLHLIYLFWPTLLYLNVYGFSLNPLFESEELDMNESDHHHVCSGISNQIRDEVEFLRKSFNVRMRRILVQATLIAYYSSFLPWAFVQPYIHYELWFVTQHLVLTWMLSFSLLLSRAFCPDFSDSLHKVACHLGRWSRLRPNHIPSQSWHPDHPPFPPGSIVKHQRELFKAEGYVPITSEPGNQTHTRFHLIFSGSSFPRLLLGYHVSLIIISLLILIRITEWYQVISVSTLLITSLFTFVRLGRDFLVVWKMYQAEEVITLRGPSNVSLSLSFYYIKRKMPSQIVLKSLSITLGLFFVFLGIVKVTSVVNKDLHKDMRREFVKYARVFPLASTVGFKVPSKWYRRITGGLEIFCGLGLALFPGVLVKRAMNGILLLMNLLGVYSHFMVDEKFERTAPALVFFFMLSCRLVVEFQHEKKQRKLQEMLDAAATDYDGLKKEIGEKID
ncbi:unnamed protein product [Allacma fusca]|uniref:Transmembrane protein 39A n=1 Tax=Allacma fusca TaxID=39272 RepID=A0A8J2NW34_9HEXA|nr:unnamed protein product [Allacma fusca]